VHGSAMVDCEKAEQAAPQRAVGEHVYVPHVHVFTEPTQISKPLADDSGDDENYF
jgi:hypothetical protein